MASWANAECISNSPQRPGGTGKSACPWAKVRVWAHGHEYTPVPSGAQPTPGTRTVFRRDAGQGYATFVGRVVPDRLFSSHAQFRAAQSRRVLSLPINLDMPALRAGQFAAARVSRYFTAPSRASGGVILSM